MRVNQCFVLLQSDESLLRATAKRLGVELTGKMHACTGRSMAKAYRKRIAHDPKCRSDKNLGGVFVDLGGRKDVASVGGKEYPLSLIHISEPTRPY